MHVIPLHLADVTYPEWHPRAGETGPVLAFAITGGARRFLVDSGIGPPQPRIDALYQPRRFDLSRALAGAGIDAAKIAGIICTHLHFDHCGGNGALDAPVYVQRAEREAAREPGYTIPEFVDLPDRRYVLLDGDAEVAPRIRIVATPGHTPGHQAVVVDTAEGPVAIAGQAVERASEYAPASDDPAVARLAALDPVAVHFSHDAEIWRRSS